MFCFTTPSYVDCRIPKYLRFLKVFYFGRMLYETVYCLTISKRCLHLCQFEWPLFLPFFQTPPTPVQNGVFSDQSKSRNLLTKENQTWKWCGVYCLANNRMVSEHNCQQCMPLAWSYSFFTKLNRIESLCVIYALFKVRLLFSLSHDLTCLYPDLSSVCILTSLQSVSWPLFSLYPDLSSVCILT